MSPKTLLEGPQKSSIFFPVPAGSGILSGLTPLRMQMASMTNFTPDGGLFMVFTRVMSWVWRAGRWQALIKMALQAKCSHDLPEQ